METEYRRTWNQSFLIIKDLNLDENYEMKMLEHNQIGGLLPVQAIEENGELYLSYDITGKKSLDSYLESRELELEVVRKILESLIHACRELDKYLLLEECLLLRQDMIFWDGHTEEFFFCYYAAERGNLKGDFKELLEELLPKLNHDKREETEAFYRLYQSVQEENYSLLELQEIFFLDEPEREKEEAEEFFATEKLIPQEEEKEVKTGCADFFKNTAYQVLERGISILHMDKLKERGKKYSMQQMEYETPLGEKASEKTEDSYARLIYLGKGEEKDFLLDQPVFLLGRDAEAADGLLHSTAVGSIQAKIYREKENYYIEDMNSNHGTLVNGEFLIYKNARRLEEGDRITFADISYRFLTFCHKSII